MRNAIVFGSSEGIGKAIAKCLLQDGNRVVLFSRSKEKLSATTEELKSISSEVYYIDGDVSIGNDRERIFKYVEENFGGCDILINNNGGPKAGSLENIDMDDWKIAFDTYAIPVFDSIKRALPYMKQQQWGRIITVGSLAVKEPIENLDLSNFIKTGLAAVHRTLTQSVAKHQVNVHMVHPAAILTERSIKRIADRASSMNISYEESLKISKSQLPKGDLGKPEDVGQLVAFLCSSKADYLTGTSIQIDGGKMKGLH